MTGRQPPRMGVPGVFGPTVNVGLPLNETTVAQQLKKAGYKTAIMGNRVLSYCRVILLNFFRLFSFRNPAYS